MDIGNVVLFDLLSARAERRWRILQPEIMRVSRRIAWPVEPVNVPSIPLHEYERTVGNTFRFSNAVNRKVEDYLNGNQ